MLAELPDDWRWGRLGDLFARVTRKNSAGCRRVLTASGEHGLIDQEEYFSKSVAGRDLETYYHLRRGEFAYNRSSMSGYPVGAIKRLEQYDEGILSTLYICFAQRPGTPLDANFAAQLFDSGALNDEIALITQVGARAHGLLNVKVSDFMEVSLPLPPLREQKKIAAILSSVDEAIQATQAVIEQTRRVKEGLLQDLLTRGIGHTRFKQTEIGEIPESWEVKRLGDLCTKITSGPRGWASYYADEGDIFLRSQNIRNGYLDWSDSQHVQPPEGAETDRARLRLDDVLITITGNNVGNVSVFRGLETHAYASQHVGIIRFVDTRLAPFFAAYLSPDGPGQQQLLRESYGQSKPGLSLVQLREFLVPEAPSLERAKIDAVVQATSTALASSEDHLSRLYATKAGLLQDLLTGKVRVSP